MLYAVDSQAITGRRSRWHMLREPAFRGAFDSHGVLGYHLTNPVIPNAAHGITALTPSHQQDSGLRGEAGERDLLFGTQIRQTGIELACLLLLARQPKK